ncbi:MAG: DUF885 family protein [Gammaproteobacteria bacterium]|nr:DUF885 family protein [Gammaproteobacteria bacterium]
MTYFKNAVTGWFLCMLFMQAAAADAVKSSDDWVAMSNKNAQIVLEIFAKYGPEGAASLGVDGLDEEIFDLNPKIYERSMADTRKILKQLQKRHDKEDHPIVQQDLKILIKSLNDNLVSSELDRENMLPYFNMTQTIFRGTRALLDPQIPEERYPAVITRLQRYAGMERGYKPITELAKARTRERFKVKGLTGPYKGEVEQDLERAQTFITEIEKLLTDNDLDGWQPAWTKLKRQLTDYNDWVRAEILPRARADFRLPAVMYQDALTNWGVDASPQDLIQTATAGYMDIRNEMVALAPWSQSKKAMKPMIIEPSSAA